MMTYRLFIVIFLKDLISTGKPKKLMNQKGSVAIIAAIALVAGITISIVPQAFASAVDDQKDQRCAPRSEFNGKDNAGNASGARPASGVSCDQLAKRRAE